MEEFNDETRCIETPRLLLRKHALQDYPLFYRMLTDPLGKRFTGGVTHLSYEERLKLYRRDIALPFSTKEGEFAVIGKDKGEYLGYCGYHWNDALRSSELFYGLRREHWGHGYGREAASAFSLRRTLNALPPWWSLKTSRP